MLEAPLTAAAQADRDWLKKKLGQRLRDPVRGERAWPPGECWEVEVLKQDGKCKWFYGPTLEDVYARIRNEAERALAEKRRSRA